MLTIIILGLIEKMVSGKFEVAPLVHDIHLELGTHVPLWCYVRGVFSEATDGY